MKVACLFFVWPSPAAFKMSLDEKVGSYGYPEVSLKASRGDDHRRLIADASVFVLVSQCLKFQENDTPTFLELAWMN